jgi:hypothetical protein
MTMTPHFNENGDIRQFKRVLYQKYLEHGLVDIYIGIFIISIFLADFIGTGLIISTTALIIGFSGPYVWTKIIEPRLGFIKFGDLKSGKTNKLVFLFIIIIIVTCLFAIILIFIGPTTPSDWEINMQLIIIGVVSLTVFSIVGFFSGVPRFYFYGMGALLIFNIGYLLNTSAFLCFVTLGIIVLLKGTHLLIRFLRNHPVRDLEDEDVIP